MDEYLEQDTHKQSRMLVVSMDETLWSGLKSVTLTVIALPKSMVWAASGLVQVDNDLGSHLAQDDDIRQAHEPVHAALTRSPPDLPVFPRWTFPPFPGVAG